ncbi:MAG: hypothetical protein M1830_000920, partial [Pleopsidium flavum]
LSPTYAKVNAVSKGKVTQAVRRILMSQKTFANHLADEEASLSAYAQQPPATPTPRSAASKVAKTPTTRLKRSSTSASTPAPTPTHAAAPESMPSPALMPGVVHTSSSMPLPPADTNPLLSPVRSYVGSPPRGAAAVLQCRASTAFAIRQAAKTLLRDLRVLGPNKMPEMWRTGVWT